MSITSPATATHLANETLIDGTPAVVEHDQSIINNETRLSGELGIASWLAADVVLPLRVFDTHIRYADPTTGQTVQIENPFLHHHNEVLVGPADPWLVARAATVVGGFTLTARVGTTIPIGSTVPNPFVLGDMGIPHEHTQFGTGTFEPIVGAEAYRSLGGVTVDAYWLTLQSLYENGYGYRAGNRYAFGASAASALGTARWRFRAMLDRTSESAESWSGTVYTTEGNIGRVDVLAGAEASYVIDDDWRAALSLKVPIYSHVVGGQVDVPLYVALTISTHAHLWKAKHAAMPPSSEPPADWTGLDKLDVSGDGAAPALEPVAGKVTVYDFWADWCVPCRVLDRALADVARRHPGELAVRKINVVDTDTLAWSIYLAPGHFNLPHAKLFGRDGKLAWERSGAAPALAAAVEDAITTAPPSAVLLGGSESRLAITSAPVESAGGGLATVAEPVDGVTEPVAAPVAGVPAPVAAPAAPRPPRIAITVTDAGYSPARVVIPRARRVVLVFTRKSEQTCAVDVHFKLPDGTRIDQRLPLGKAVEIPIQVDRAGEIAYACGMDMIRGTLVVQ
jgi:thiol-disulfide isomerase/thioredoxin